MAEGKRNGERRKEDEAMREEWRSRKEEVRKWLKGGIMERRNKNSWRMEDDMTEG